MQKVINQRKKTERHLIKDLCDNVTIVSQTCETKKLHDSRLREKKQLIMIKTDILQLELEMLRISVDEIETLDIEKGKLLDVCETITTYAQVKRNNKCMCKPPHKILHICMSILKPIKTALKKYST